MLAQPRGPGRATCFPAFTFSHCTPVLQMSAGHQTAPQQPPWAPSVRAARGWTQLWVGLAWSPELPWAGKQAGSRCRNLPAGAAALRVCLHNQLGQFLICVASFTLPVRAPQTPEPCPFTGAVIPGGRSKKGFWAVLFPGLEASAWPHSTRLGAPGGQDPCEPLGPLPAAALQSPAKAGLMLYMNHRSF